LVGERMDTKPAEIFVSMKIVGCYKAKAAMDPAVFGWRVGDENIRFTYGIAPPIRL